MTNNAIKLRVGAFSSRLTPLFNENLCSKNGKAAFSIAEAMIVFTIVSVALASAAPMISKQMRHNDLSDVMSSVLSQKIESLKQEFNKSKWHLSPNESNITRPSGNVGVGVSTNVNPTAKLHVVTPSNENSWMFKVQKGTDMLPFSVDNNGIVSVRSLGDDATTRFRFVDKDGNIKTSITNAGVVRIRPTEEWTTFQVQNVNNAPSSDKYEYINAAGEVINTVYSNQGFVVLGHGGIRLNYEETTDSSRGIDNSAAGGPVAMYVDGGNRFSIQEAGQAVFSFATDDARGSHITSTFVVRNCDKNCGPGATWENLLNVQKNGITTLKQLSVKTDAHVIGNLNVSGDIKHKGSSILAMMDEKFAKMENELSEYKNLVVQLQQQNDILAQKIAELEAGDVSPVISELKKLASFNK